MNKPILIGFVILTWNSENYIEECLRSIFEMNQFSCFVQIIDNGSTDRTVDIVSACQQKYNWRKLSLIHLNQNRGTTVSRNIGIQNLIQYRPDYISILDSDTIVNQKAFLSMVGEMKKHSNYGIIGPKMIGLDGSVLCSARAFPTLPEKVLKAIPIKIVQSIGESMQNMPEPVLNELSYPVDYLQSACWLVKPEIFEAVGPFDENIFYAPEDAEYCIRVWKTGYQVAYCPEAVIIHRWQRLSKKKLFSRINWEHLKGLIYMFRKHRYLFRAEKLRHTF